MTIRQLPSQPPPEYRLGLLFEADGNHSEANAAFQLVAERYPQAVGEGGLPLATCGVEASSDHPEARYRSRAGSTWLERGGASDVSHVAMVE